MSLSCNIVIIYLTLARLYHILHLYCRWKRRWSAARISKSCENIVNGCLTNILYLITYPFCLRLNVLLSVNVNMQSVWKTWRWNDNICVSKRSCNATIYELFDADVSSTIFKINISQTSNSAFVDESIWNYYNL